MNLNPEFPRNENLAEPRRIVLPKRRLARYGEPEKLGFYSSINEEGQWPNPEDFENRRRSNEIANPQAKFIDFFAMSARRRSVFTKDSAKFDHSVRLFVHPYFYIDNLFSAYEQKRQERVDLILRRVLTHDRSERPPVIIMEDYKRIPDLFDMIKGFNLDDVYIAPTFSGSSQPYPDNESLGVSRDKSFHCKNWMRFIDPLRDSGVKKIIVGGIRFNTQPFESEKDAGYSYSGCAGYAISNLEDYFDVSVSNAV